MFPDSVKSEVDTMTIEEVNAEIARRKDKAQAAKNLIDEQTQMRLDRADAVIAYEASLAAWRTSQEQTRQANTLVLADPDPDLTLLTDLPSKPDFVFPVPAASEDDQVQQSRRKRSGTDFS